MATIKYPVSSSVHIKTTFVYPSGPVNLIILLVAETIFHISCFGRACHVQQVRTPWIIVLSQRVASSPNSGCVWGGGGVSTGL